MNNNFNLKQFLAEGRLLKEDTQSSFKQLLDNIPNEKYIGELEDTENQYGEIDDSDLVDTLYDSIFDNELKGKPGVEGDNFNDFQDIERDKNGGDIGPLETLLIDKIRNIISDYRKLNSSNQTGSNGDKTSQIEALLKQEYPEIINDGEVEKGTEEWLFLLQLALKVYGLNIANEYDILKAVDGEGPYAKQVANLGYGYVSDLEQALENLGVEVY
jgi:hypothetical protein